jgi:hypothetical protein
MTKTVTAPVRISFTEARRQHTEQAVADLAPVIAELRASGVTSLRASLQPSTNAASRPRPGPVVGITLR